VNDSVPNSNGCRLTPAKNIHVFVASDGNLEGRIDLVGFFESSGQGCGLFFLEQEVGQKLSHGERLWK